MEETDRLEVVHPVHQKITVTSKTSGQDDNGGETPIDYSMINKKRRLLQMSPRSGTKTALDYGSDGLSDDRSSSGSPHDSNHDSGLQLASSLDMEHLDDEHLDDEHNIQHHHPRLHDIHQQQPSQQQQSALHLFLQAQQHHQHQQQQQQHPDHVNPFLRLSALSQQAGLRWPEQASSPPIIVQPPTLPPPTSGATLELARATHESQLKFAEFRETLMRQIQSSRAGGSSNNGAAKARQLSPAAVSDSVNSDAAGDDKDNAYWERRRKNNEAAKRSRDARRAKEQEIALRAQFLEQENISMKLEIAHLKAENAQLRRQFQHHLKL